MRLRIPIVLLFSPKTYRIILQHILHRKPLLRDYLKNTEYPDDDYSWSDIDNYVPLPRYISGLSRLMKRDDLQDSGEPQLYLPLKNLFNARDWFGWGMGRPGHSPRTGRIFRGSCLDNLLPAEIEYLKQRVNIGAELDLRGEADALPTSILGDDVLYGVVRLHPYLHGVKHQSAGYREALRFMLSALRAGRNIYVHCAGGADRTGCFFFLVGAALGLSESDLCKDYELSSFSSYGIRKRCYSSANSHFPFVEMIQYIKSSFSGCFQEQVLAWWARGNEQQPGITESEWAPLRQLMM